MTPLGQRLQRERIKKGLSIEEVAKATKIRPMFITALEEGDYKKLPSSAYIQGFIKNYAEFLNLSKRETLALFRREFDEREFLGVLPESFAKSHRLRFSGFRFQTRTLVIIAGLLFIFGFIFFEYRSAFLSPKLVVSFPSESAHITTSAGTIVVIGSTDPNTMITIDDIPVYIGKDGEFRKNITIFIGSNTIMVKAVNKFGRQTIVIRHIIVK